MKKINLTKILVNGLVFSLAISLQSFAADSGSCGPNCIYTYDRNTQTLTFTGTGEHGEGIVNQPTKSFGLSGSVKNAIISEGITEVGYIGSSYTIDNIGTASGKLVIPSTLTNFGNNASYLLGFGTVEINSKNITFGEGALEFKGGLNATIVMSADANMSFDDNLLYCPYFKSWQLPAKLNISCKGNPDACLSKFGNALNKINQNKISVDYYSETDINGNVILKYHDNGYYTYDVKGNINGRFNLSGTEQYDESGNIIAKYDAKGNLLEKYSYDAGGNIITSYNANGIATYKRTLYTPAEAAVAVKTDNSNTVTITFK